MSLRTNALCSIKAAAQRASGSHETREARIRTMSQLVYHCYSRGLQIRGISSIKGKHIASFIEAQKANNLSPRTLQNQLSHVRESLAASGKTGLAQHPTISNEAFGVAGAPRHGTKVAATPEQYAKALQDTGNYSIGVQACLRLERELGLRAKEAIMSPASLSAWEKALSKPEANCLVVHGTKGGRERYIHPADRETALAAVQNASFVRDSQEGKLIPGTLKQAIAHYRNCMSRHCDITGHQLRYAYAQASVDRYRAQGESWESAYAKTSLELGHGDGRGRWVRQVYDQRSPR